MKKVKHPKIDLITTEKEKFLAIAGWLILIGMIVYTIVLFGKLPEEIPQHFNFSGEPDCFGSSFSFFVLPVVALAVNILVMVLNRHPHKFNYMVTITPENAEYQYHAARYLLLGISIFMNILFFVIQHGTYLTAIGQKSGLDPLLMIFVVMGDMAILIYYMVKTGSKK